MYYIHVITLTFVLYLKNYLFKTAIIQNSKNSVSEIVDVCLFIPEEALSNRSLAMVISLTPLEIKGTGSEISRKSGDS